MLGEFASDYELIMIELTNACNLNCEYCSRGMMNNKNIMLTEREFRARLQSIKPGVSILFCGLGEQFTHPHIYDFIAIAKDNMLQLVTNGTILIDYDRLLKNNNIQSLTFSLDGPNEDIMTLSCKNYNFNNLEKNLQGISKKEGVGVAINCVVLENNLDYLKEMLDICEKYNVHALNLILPTNNLKWVNKNLDKIEEKFKELLVYKREYNVAINLPDTMYCKYNDYITPYISVEGYVRPCCSHDRWIHAVGNIKRESMADLINSSIWRKFKEITDCRDCSMNQYAFPKLKESV